jgi:organic radical activating enzyme
MEIIEVKQRWPADRLRIEIMIGNLCNYSCWYCFPGSNEGTHRWPDFELFVNNLKFLLNYYKKNLNKNTFELHIVGGEPTLWPKLGEFIVSLKQDFDCIISISTNGSRTLRWWNTYGGALDKVILSCHHAEVNVPHYIEVADLLYSKGVIVTGLVLMDPNAWDRCIELIEELKKSKFKWAIDAQEVYHASITYNQHQLAFLKNYRIRKNNIFQFLRYNKHKILRTSVTLQNHKIVKVKNNEIVLRKLNHFKGWLCNLGIDSVFIDKTGKLTGACRNNLYHSDSQYNLYDADFKNIFSPTLQPTLCNTNECQCQPESNLSKHKIIPISIIQST